MGFTTFKDLKHIPGDRGLPIFGNFFQFVQNTTPYFESQRAKHGDVFKSYSMFFGANVVLCGPAANKFLLVDQAKFTSNKEAWERVLAEFFPNGLMLMDGAQHKYHRSIMLDAFKKEPMQGYLDKMPELIDYVLQDLKGKEQILAFPFFKNATLKIAGNVFFGLPLNADLSKVNQAITDIVNASAALPINLPFTNYRKGIDGRRFLIQYFKSIIHERRTKPGKDLFSILCKAENEEGAKFTDQEIIDHLIFILMASHDTTAITLTLMSYFLAKHSSWQDNLRNEIEAVNLSAPIKVNDLKKLHKVGMVMKETLRLHPPLITVGRKTEKDIEINGYFIPKNTMVNANFLLTHQDDRNFTNPKTFDPERFNQERREELKCPFAYAPFGAGPHHCIGYSFAEMSVKMVIKELLKRYKLFVPEGYECPIKDVPLKQPKDNLPLFIQPIH